MNVRAISPLAPLERGNGVALYRQIQHQLMDQIRSGAFQPSEPLPSVEGIASGYGVSLMTAGQAVRSLCELGLTYSKQGKGTFISRAKVEKNFRRVLSFTEEMKLRGSTPRSRVLSLRLCAPAKEVRKALELDAGEKIYRLHRVRMADGAPMGVEVSWLPARSCPDLPRVFQPDLPAHEVYRQLFRLYSRLHDAFGSSAWRGRPTRAATRWPPRSSSRAKRWRWRFRCR